MKRLAAALVVAVLLATGAKGCGSSDGGGGTSGQTDYSKLRCSTWLGWPADVQDASGTDLAQRLGAFDTSDAFGRQFAADITTDCKAGPSLTVADVAAGLATLDTTDFK